MPTYTTDVTLKTRALKSRSLSDLNALQIAFKQAQHNFALGKRTWVDNRDLPRLPRVVHAPVAMEIIGDKTLWMMR